MKNRYVLIILALILMVFQLVTSYYIYMNVTFPVLVKVTLIVAANWIWVFYAIVFVFRDYSNLTSHVSKINSKYRLTMILYDLLKELAEMENKKDVYERILRAAIEAIPNASMGSILLIKNDKMIFETAVGFDFDVLELIELDLEDVAIYRMTDGKMDQAVIVKDIVDTNPGKMDPSKLDMLQQGGSAKIHASITAPIRIDGEVIGCLSLDSPKSNQFQVKDLEVLEIFAYEAGKFVQLYQALEKNVIMSRYDELTETYSRAYCNKLFKDLVSNHKPFILISVDLNNLKEVNDLFGHDIGDRLIKNFVKQMRLFLQKDVIFARYGGDEFLLIFPGYTKIEAQVVVDDAATFFHNQGSVDTSLPISVSFSYGMVEYPLEATDYDELLKIADRRMYEEKRRYKENLVVKF